jgi:hypothetical protein
VSLCGCSGPLANIRNPFAKKEEILPGERIAVELIQALAETSGVAGVHVMAPANDAAVPRVIAAARERLPRR